ncbi:MAG TPA: neutral zinc metallopeptidase [Bauldia sp.]|nr:neutral zinc metallopeptidase [Bauldia sp.]
MRWMGRRESSNVEDRRGEGGGFGGLGGGMGGFSRGGGLGGIPIGRGGGIGGIVLVGVILLGGWLLGVDPSTLLSGGTSDTTTSQPGTVGAPSDKEGKFVATVLADTEDTWAKLLPAQAGKSYRNPTLVLFDGQTGSACGLAQSAVGPFYCPNDERLYIDLSFYRELAQKLGAPGDFAEAYVIAHEVGHHVQNVLGTLPDVDRRRAAAGETESNRLSVRLELQADCYAGVWAHETDTQGTLEPGDIDEALTAAAAVGDDKLQKEGQGYVVPDSFTHGTAAQRSAWFKRGYDTGKISACDTFGAGSL